MPSGQAVPTLLVHDGGLGAMVAAMTLPAPARAYAWGTRPDAAAFARRHAEALGMAGVLVHDDPAPAGPLRTSRTLLAACAAAVEQGCPVILWPHNAGHDVRTLADAADIARLVARAAAIDNGGRGRPGQPTAGGGVSDLRIDAPFLDMSDVQLAELALDLEAPLDPGWWDDADHARWARAFEAARDRLRRPLAASPLG